MLVHGIFQFSGKIKLRQFENLKSTYFVNIILIKKKVKKKLRRVICNELLFYIYQSHVKTFQIY